MSRAFVKEDAAENFDELPERPVSEYPNYVTERGLTLIQAEIARLQQEHAAAQASEDRAALARTSRDLRYWTARHATAQVIAPPENASEVRFGVTVVLGRYDGREQTFRIVGEDEADPARGTLSHVSPLAGALYGKTVGDVVQSGSTEVEILAIK